MSNKNKVTDGKIPRPIRMISILVLALLIPLTVSTADLNADLIKVVLKGHTATMKGLLFQGADIKTRDRIYGKTPLHLAVEKGHQYMVELLVSKGGEVSAKDESGETALGCAARCGHIEFARLLEEAGA